MVWAISVPIAVFLARHGLPPPRDKLWIRPWHVLFIISKLFFVCLTGVLTCKLYATCTEMLGKAILRLRIQENPFGSRGSAQDPAEGAYSAPANPLAGEEGLAAPPQEPHPRSPPFGPRLSYPTPKLFPTSLTGTRVRIVNEN